MIRIYNLRDSLFNKRMINLKYISSFTLEGNKIFFHFAHEKQGIIGNFLFFGGGGNAKEEITFTSNTEAQKEFKEIQSILEANNKIEKV